MPKDKDKRPVGRPSMTDDEKRKLRSIKMTDTEWKAMQDLADEVGISVAELIRRKVFGG